MQLSSVCFLAFFGQRTRHARGDVSNCLVQRKNPQFTATARCCVEHVAPNSKPDLAAAHSLTSKYQEPLAEPYSGLESRHFINLTNGIEALPQITSLLTKSEIRFTRIQSSHCESGAYDKLLASLDHELLFSLACGRDCYIYDFASRNKSRGVPRALFMGLEFMKWSVSYLWFTDSEEMIPERVSVRGKNTVPFWRDEVMPYMIAKDTKKKVRYFAPFAKEMGVREVKLHGVYGRVSEIDGCKEIHVKMVRDWLAGEGASNQCNMSKEKIDKLIEGCGFAEFRADSTGEELVSIQEWMEGFR